MVEKSSSYCMLPGSHVEEELLNDAKDLWKLPLLEKVFYDEWQTLMKSRHPLAQKADKLGYDIETLTDPPPGLNIPDDLRQWGERHKRFRKVCVEVLFLREIEKRYGDLMRSRSPSFAGGVFASPFTFGRGCGRDS